MRTTVRNSYTPKTGDYCNMIVVDNDKQVQYIFDCDGVYSTYTSKNQEGAPKSYVDARDAEVLAAAKAYTDAYNPSDMATVTYVQEQDANTLQAAKDYADSMDVVTLGQAQDLISSATTSVTNTLGGQINDLSNSLSTVARTGQYSDLLGLPDIPVITMTTVDPGEGAPLAANHFIAVYVDQESE